MSTAELPGLSTPPPASGEFRVWGLVAAFENAQDVYHACENVRQAGYEKFDSYTPFMVHGIDRVSGKKRSKVPIFTLVGGVTGFILGNIIVWYMNGFDYPLIVGGKPYYSPVFPFPISYELTILLASFGTLAGMFILNLMPQYYHPLFNHPEFFKVTDDRFFVAIHRSDPKFQLAETRAYLESLGATSVAIVPE